MRFGSLFSGIGGFDLGFENSGMECAWQCEIDKKAREILKRHWSTIFKFNDVKKLSRRVYDCFPEDENGDIICPRCNTEFGSCECIGTDELLDEYGKIDLLCGGFPCQDISAAGNKWGSKGLRGVNSSLWFEFLRIIREIDPTWIVIENTGRLRNGENGKNFKIIVEGLDQLNYVGIGMVLDAAAFGLPARRSRIFIVARKRFSSSGFQEAQRLAEHFLRKDVGCFVLQERGQSFSEDYGASRPSSSNYRMLTPIECSRSLGFPDNWNEGFSNTVRYKQLGNSVAVPVVEWIGKTILSYEEKYDNQCST